MRDDEKERSVEERTEEDRREQRKGETWPEPPTQRLATHLQSCERIRRLRLHPDLAVRTVQRGVEVEGHRDVRLRHLEFRDHLPVAMRSVRAVRGGSLCRKPQWQRVPLSGREMTAD